MRLMFKSALVRKGGASHAMQVDAAMQALCTCCITIGMNRQLRGSRLMIKSSRVIVFLATLLLPCWSATSQQLPENFVYLADIEPSIQQEVRYWSNDNFLGRQVAGYDAPACILLRPVAYALQKVQKA